MGRAYWIHAAIAGTCLVTIAAANGCTINPFDPNGLDRPNQSTGAGGVGGSMGCLCSDDGNACTDDLAGQTCPGGDAKACHMVVAQRQCTQTNESPGVCDNAGVCVGQPCQTDGDCKDGNCVDGYCCNSTCDGPCNACNRVPGTCSQLPFGMAGECPIGELCGNAGGCINQAKAALGAVCASAANCASAACIGQLCVSQPGQPCVEHLECASRLCDPTTHTCVACGGSVMCPDGAACLPSGQCPVLLGQPAANSMECVPPGVVADGLTCTLPIDAVCANHFECIYHHCNGAPNGTCAANCSVDAECPPGIGCNKDKGWCFLPPGSFCVIDDQCQGPVNSGKCAGFPRRCQ